MAASSQLPPIFDTHDVGKLLKTSGAVLAGPERDLALRLNAAVVWSGRYPIPKYQKDMTAMVASSDFKERFASLFRRLRRLAIERSAGRKRKTKTEADAVMNAAIYDRERAAFERRMTGILGAEIVPSHRTDWDPVVAGSNPVARPLF